MALFRNKAPGARGINMKDGRTVWVEAGEEKEIEGAVKSAHPDLEEVKPAPKAKPPAKDADKGA